MRVLFRLQSERWMQETRGYRSNFEPNVSTFIIFDVFVWRVFRKNVCCLYEAVWALSVTSKASCSNNRKSRPDSRMRVSVLCFPSHGILIFSVSLSRLISSCHQCLSSKPGVMVSPCTVSTQEGKAEEWQVQDWPRLHSKVESQKHKGWAWNSATTCLHVKDLEFHPQEWNLGN